MRIIASDAAPKAIGPYSQAIATDRLVFTAGQVALDPKSGELIGRTTAEQTEQVFANLKAVLSAAGTSLAHVVKTTVYLADMADFAQMNERSEERRVGKERRTASQNDYRNVKHDQKTGLTTFGQFHKHQ